MNDYNYRMVVNNIKSFRKRWGLRQDELAELTNVSRHTIIALEKGNYNPSVELALKIAGVFDVRVDEIFKVVDK